MQLREAFRQLSTSQRMIDGLQTFQKSACIENWPPLESAACELVKPLAVFQRSRIDRVGSLTRAGTGGRDA